MSADDPKVAPDFHYGTRRCNCETDNAYDRVMKTARSARMRMNDLNLQKGDLVLDPSGRVTEVRNPKAFTKQPIKVYRKNNEDDYVAIWWGADEG